MAVDNFKPILWEGALLHNFHSVSIADVMCTKPSNVNGKTVTFNRVAAGSLKDYSGTVDWAEIETTPVEMTFDKKKYFAFALDDVDKVQLKADVMTATTQEHSAVLAEQYDKDFFVALTTGVKLKIGAAGSKKKVTPANAYDYIVDLGTMLSEKKVPKTERYVTVNAAYLGLLSKDKRFTANPNVLANGVVEGQKINGMQVMCSEELPANQIVAHHNEYVTVHLKAVPVMDYSDYITYSQDYNIDFTIRDYRRGINHLICAGKGQNEERIVVHLYVQKDGSIGKSKYYQGLDERTALYDFSSADLEKLEEDGVKRLKELMNYKEVNVEVKDADLELGDIIGGYEQITGTEVKKPIVRKILKIEDGEAKIEYKVKGDD